MNRVNHEQVEFELDSSSINIIKFKLTKSNSNLKILKSLARESTRTRLYIYILGRDSPRDAREFGACDSR